MKLTNLLSERRPLIQEKWLHLVFDSYPAETSGFLKREKDRFNNPVAYRISEGIKGLYEALLKEMDRDRLLHYLDEVIRIRAVQDFSPSQSLAFIFLLKNVLREELAGELQDPGLAAEFLDLESRIDGLALLGFDVYTKRREMVHDLKVTEIKNRVSAVLRRTGISLNDS
jgi:hypothetical protein